MSMRWADHVARTREMKKKIVVSKPESARPLERHGCI